MPGMQTCFSVICCFRDSTALYLRATALIIQNLERRAFTMFEKLLLCERGIVGKDAGARKLTSWLQQEGVATLRQCKTHRKTSGARKYLFGSRSSERRGKRFLLGLTYRLMRRGCTTMAARKVGTSRVLSIGMATLRLDTVGLGSKPGPRWEQLRNPERVHRAVMCWSSSDTCVETYGSFVATSKCFAAV
jgi:hypothetical protein